MTTQTHSTSSSANAYDKLDDGLKAIIKSFHIFHAATLDKLIIRVEPAERNEALFEATYDHAQALYRELHRALWAEWRASQS
jgi:hypothetical protein